MGQFSIQTVAKKTGLSTHLIRIWERRYQAINPMRLDSGHRRYSDKDIQRLGLLHKLIKLGFKISDIANKPIIKLESLIATISDPNESENIEEILLDENKKQALINQAIEAIANNDKEKLESIIIKILSELTQWKCFDQILSPLLIEIGKKWEVGEFSIYQEHFATKIIDSLLLRHNYSFTVSNHAPKVILATPSGYSHSLGLSMAERVAYMEGFNVINLGSGVPLSQVAHAVKKFGATTIGLSLIFPIKNPTILEELKMFRKMMDPTIDITTGGRTAHFYLHQIKEMGMIYIRDLKDYRDYLRRKQTGEKK